MFIPAACKILPNNDLINLNILIAIITNVASGKRAINASPNISADEPPFATLYTVIPRFVTIINSVKNILIP